MSTELDPLGSEVAIGRVRLRTPGLVGTAEQHPPGSPNLRSVESATEAFERALDRESVRPQVTVELRGTREVTAGGARTRSTQYGEPAIEVEVPAPVAALEQVLLYVDEAGVATWNFAAESPPSQETTRGDTTRTYVVRRHVPTASDHADQRGLVGVMGKKLLKVLVFPLIDPVIGEVGDYFAHRWEQSKRPYRLRSFTPDDYAAPDAALVDGDRWNELSSGRALLMIHGTLSRTHTAFGRLPASYVADLDRQYEGRVFAFDHYTLSEDPKQNIEWFIQQLPESIKLNVDVVCHSRGGLVSRVLAEKQAELSLGSRSVNVGKIVFVATPNAGTVLTDAKYLGELIDRYTNILNFFPDNGVTEVFEGVITVMKHLAVGSLKGLEGLQSMAPDGDFLRRLNTDGKSDSRYFALSSNYEPADRGLAAFLSDRVVDGIFSQADNDLVVPTNGVFDTNGAAGFPIDEPYVIPLAEAVAHTKFFGSRDAQQRIMTWLNA